jgi:hypothetical protein
VDVWVKAVPAFATIAAIAISKKTAQFTAEFVGGLEDIFLLPLLCQMFEQSMNWNFHFHLAAPGTVHLIVAACNLLHPS